MVEHCVSVLTESRKQRVFQNYIADGVKFINEAIAQQFNGVYLQDRFIELIEPQNKEPERTGDEIAADIIKRAGLKMR